MPSIGSKGKTKKRSSKKVAQAPPQSTGDDLRRFQWLLDQLSPLPDEMSSDCNLGNQDKTQECDDYEGMIRQWKSCMRWRDEMEQVLLVMLAVIISTEQKGDQLFLMLLANAGSGKTRFCDALLTSQHCHALEHLTGFHSGWKGDDGEDYSLIARVDRKTMITPEGDVLISSPSFAQVMSQQRRIFDGKSGASYKNQKEDKNYEGLRTPWIIAGTHTLMDSDQSRLGDRFLKIHMSSPGLDEKRMIQERVAVSAFESVMEVSNAQDKELNEGKMAKAYQMTGGFVNFLRDNSQTRIRALMSINVEEVQELCVQYGEFAADFRARPNLDENKESNDTKEEPNRLTSQFLRLMICCAAVRGEDTISDFVHNTVRKVVIDTSKGRTFEMATEIFRAGELSMRQLYVVINLPEARIRKFIRFLIAIDVVRKVDVKMRTNRGTSRKRASVYRLTTRVKKLMRMVLNEAPGKRAH